MREASEARVVVSGRVQGVWFRASTQDVAQGFGVCGFVRNLPDRRVEAVLQGSRAAVERTIAFMREGPPGAQVVDVSVEWREPTEPFEGFHVRH